MKKLLLATIICSLAVSANAATIYVDANGTGANNGTSWTDAYNFLQDALADARSDPDINQIHVAQGMYTPDTTSSDPNGTSDRYASFALINGVALYGGFPSGGSALQDRDPNIYETILSGDIGTLIDANDNCYHVFYHPSGTNLDETAILDGFTITAGNADGSGPQDPRGRGGGMFNDNSSPTVSNCTFSGNSVGSVGGGMYNAWYSSPIVTNCTFSSNSSAGFGGGMSNDNSSSPTVTGCTFSGNSAYYFGGGMFNLLSSPTVTGCTFSGNSTDNEGGGMFNYYDSSPTVTNCTFSSNSSAGFGGGMSNYYDSSPTVTNCTFSSNSASDDGGGMYNINSSSPTVTNCILWGDTAGSDGNEIALFSSSTIDVNYCDVQGGQAGIYNDGGTINWGSGNIDADPLFVDPLNDDFHLQCSPPSPCIDAGDPDLAYNDPDGTRNDMGAFYAACVTTVAFDIKPQSCPNPMVVKGRGVLTVAIVGSESFDVYDIDVSTLLLEGAAPIRSGYEDVATPVDGDECECTTEAGDGFDDLTLKFNRADIVPGLGAVHHGDVVVLTLTGELLDGTSIEGADCVVIVGKADPAQRPPKK